MGERARFGLSVVVFALMAYVAAPPATPRAQSLSADGGMAKNASRLDPAFAVWLVGFRAEAEATGLPRQLLDESLSGLVPDYEIIDLLHNQPELERTVWDYLDRVVSDERIALGREMLALHAALLDTIEATYGVDRHIVVAIWGIESRYGQSMGARSVVRSLATLAFAGGRRAGYGRTQLLAALKILQLRDVAPEAMRGSWAGAVGHTQFIPTTFLEHAVDFDHDGRRDLWGSLGDALASTAQYLARSGWEAGQGWGYQVRLPPGFDHASAGLHAKKTNPEWAATGLTREDGSSLPASDRPMSLILPAGASGPAFLVSANFRAILKYNNAIAYALSVSHLAERLRGAGAISGSWPRHERPLLKPEREQLQRLLTARGYEVGEIDGVIGTRTKAAMRDFQQREGLPADAFATIGLLERIRNDAPLW